MKMISGVSHISTVECAEWTLICAFADFLTVVFVTSNNFTHNLLFYFQYYCISYASEGSLCLYRVQKPLRPAGGVKHSDSDLVETRMLSAKKALR